MSSSKEYLDFIWQMFFYYPFSDVYKIAVIPVSIVIDLIFYFVITKTGLYKNALESTD